MDPLNPNAFPESESTLRFRFQNFPLDPELPEETKLCTHCKLCYDSEGEFYPTCSLSTDLQLAHADHGGRFATLERDEALLARILLDPVLWAKTELNWEARWYQADMLRCTAHKKIARIGRRAGKTSSLAVDILHKCVTQIGALAPLGWQPGMRRKYNVLVVCPYESQVAKIWEELNNLIDNSNTVKDQIIRNVATPYHTIEFANGSVIKGFTAGSKTNSRSVKIRGEDADYIALDEADYLTDDDLQAILAILASRSTCLLWISSTPTGFRNKFWQFCTRREIGFKEFKYPSHVSPTYTAEAELFFRELYSDNDYRHEVLAEFGEATSGVFRNSDIDACRDLSLYSYEDCTPVPSGLMIDMLPPRVMGVDWNENAGIHAVILEWERDAQLLKLIAKEIIPAVEFKQLSALKTLIDFYLRWHCQWLYCDRQAGTMHIEHLHRFGMENPHTLLHKRVKPIGFNEKMEVRDPFLEKKWDKKPVKPLVLNIARRRIEQHQCLFPVEEHRDRYRGSNKERQKNLLSQLRAFHIVRLGQGGVPVYSQGEDHTLIAWTCAVFGIVTQYTDYLEIRQRIRPANLEVVPLGLPESLTGFDRSLMGEFPQPKPVKGRGFSRKPVSRTRGLASPRNRLRSNI